jgi:hypothetical protein
MTNHDRHFEHLDPAALNPPATLFESGRTLCFSLVIIGAILCALGWMMNPHQFYFSYLASWSFCWTTLMGVLFFVMLHYLVDAGWSTVVRRPAEQLLAATPVIVLALIPILIGAFSGSLLRWVTVDPASDHLLKAKLWWLNKPFLAIRLAVYVIAWMAMAGRLRRNSIHQDHDGAARWTISSRRWSAGGIFLYAFTLSACAYDLLMALDYHWFSTVFAVYVWSGGVVAGLCVIALVVLLLRTGPLRQYVGSDQVHDLGKLIFAFSSFWGYIAFSQYFLIWYGNIPEETTWMLRRWYGTTANQPAWWFIFSVLVGVIRFVIPFFFMMSAHPKRNPRLLATMCCILLLGHWIDQYWIVQPENASVIPPLRWIWIDLAALMLIVGLCGIIFIRVLRKASLVPTGDPRLVEALSSEHVEEIEQADVE